MQKLATILGLAVLCAGITSHGYAQDSVAIADDCSAATVNGVDGTFWRVTENGTSKWVILDSDENFLADAPERCVAALTAMIDGEPSEPPLSPPGGTPAPASAASPATSASTGATGLSPAQAQEILARHNHWRQAAGVPALTWSPEAAAFAQQWAEELDRQGCVMKHRPRSGPFTQKHGENLYKAGPVTWSDGRTEVQQVAADKVVDNWDSEKADYDYDSNTCAANRVCGHYTQLVSARSTHLGCGMKVCGNKSQVWVCNYDPAGNMNGERPF